jgi:chromosome partitioning protein
VVANIITVAQQKGGAGKTTMVAHLAACYARKQRVAVIDIDPQGSLTAWHAARVAYLGEEQVGITLARISGWRVQSEIDRLRHTHDIILVDSPPHTDVETRSAIRAADLVVVPIQPSPMDVWATEATIRLCKQENVPVKMVLNRVHAQARITEAISGAMVGLTGARFGNRVIYAGALLNGLGVTEAEPNSAAAEEVRRLAKEIARYITRARTQKQAS